MEKFGIELELTVVLILQILANSFFAKFELETPALRKIIKWFIIVGATGGIYFWLHHLALLFPFISIIPGTIYHFYWCKKNGIDPIKATPRKKYYQLRNWKWEE